MDPESASALFGLEGDPAVTMLPSRYSTFDFIRFSNIIHAENTGVFAALGRFSDPSGTGAPSSNWGVRRQGIVETYNASLDVSIFTQFTGNRSIINVINRD